MSGKRGEVALNVSITVNGVLHSDDVLPRMTLADYLRERLGLTGTHLGCEHGVCGCCTVLFDGEPVRACTILAVQANDHAITTVEGLAIRTEDGSVKMSDVQEAFWECHGLQCGYCTPGMLLTATALLQNNPDPSEEEIREAISGNICRCTGYMQIVEAIQLAARKRKGVVADAR
ncbi:MAG: (2Fe-2S)-binding protein [Alicyclobacillus macrosporangiidus]|nr:(2Fe-2S)-binding protein [Alicyclobacillus macrosporangiidus]